MEDQSLGGRLQDPPIPQAQIQMSDDERITTIKDFRTDIDFFFKLRDKLAPSRLVSLFSTNLERGFMWLGESLKECGSASPYVSSEDPNSAVIEPTADHTKEVAYPSHFLDYDQTGKVKFLRGMLSGYLIGFKLFVKTTPGNEDFLLCLTESRKAMMEAKMWLGWELGRIRDGK